MIADLPLPGTDEQSCAGAAKPIASPVQTAQTQGHVHGYLKLRFRPVEMDGPLRTIVDVLGHHPPMRMVRAFPQADGSALVHLHNVSGGVLGGDRLEVTAVVGAGARAMLTTTGATRIYRHRAGRPDARQITSFAVAPGALLEYLPDALIPFAGARYCQSTHVTLEGDAGLFVWEILSPGREARGEVFAYERLLLETEITADGQPIAYEKMDVMPARRALNSPARLGRYRSLATFFVCRGGQSALVWSALETHLAQLAAEFTIPHEVTWGVSTLVADGLVIRGLAREARRLTSALPLFWRTAKEQLYGLDAVMPRKIY